MNKHIKTSMLMVFLLLVVLLNLSKPSLSKSHFYSDASLETNFDGYVPDSYNMKNSMENYFYHLTNCPTWYAGNCGYIAMSMLLSYCDYFYDDGFIPSEFENIPLVPSTTDFSLSNLESPGVIKKIGIPNTFKYNGEVFPITYEQHFALLQSYGLNTNSTRSFMWYLRNTAIGVPDVEGFESEHAYQTTGNIIKGVLNKYINGNGSDYPAKSLNGDYILYYYDYDFNSPINSDRIQASDLHPGTNITNSAFLISKAIQIINAGFPVLIGGYVDDRIGSDGHAAVAYKSVGGNIISNFGDQSTTSFNFLSKFPVVSSIYSIIPIGMNNDYSSESYYIDLNNNLMLDSTDGAAHYFELGCHNHYYHYNTYSTQSHQKICYCGHSELARHNFEYSSFGKLICSDCGLIKNGFDDNKPINSMGGQNE